jgi:DNA-binding MarR family transcriptional regulator
VVFRRWWQRFPKRRGSAGLLDRAQRRGLVERATAPHDRPDIHIRRLTAEGRRPSEQIAAQANATLSRRLDALPACDRTRLPTFACNRRSTARRTRGVDLGTQRSRRG